jgi:hypothetical protein
MSIEKRPKFKRMSKSKGTKQDIEDWIDNILTIELWNQIDPNNPVGEQETEIIETLREGDIDDDSTVEVADLDVFLTPQHIIHLKSYDPETVEFWNGVDLLLGEQTKTKGGKYTHSIFIDYDNGIVKVVRYR